MPACTIYYKVVYDLILTYQVYSIAFLRLNSLPTDFRNNLNHFKTFTMHTKYWFAWPMS